jgi:uncharacterized protein (TIGR03067 family)
MKRNCEIYAQLCPEFEMEISANFTRLGWLMLLVCLLAGCRVDVIAGSSDDTEKWQGIWRMVACTYDGEPQKADMEWIVAGDHYNIRMNGKSGEDPYMIKLDSTHKHIDVFHHETPPGTSGGSLKGIYEVSDDSLTVCYDLTDQRYPESFDAKRGSRQVLYQFRRE